MRVTLFLIRVTLRVTPYVTLHPDNRHMIEVIS